MNVVPIKGAKLAPKDLRSYMDIWELTPTMLEKLHPAPFQRPVRINSKVMEVSELIKENKGVLPGILTLGSIDGGKTIYKVIEAELEAKAGDDPDVEALDTERDQIESAIKMSAFTEADKKMSGCVVSIDHHGLLEVVPGYIEPKAKGARAESAGAGGSGSNTSTAKSTKKPDVSMALGRRLKQQHDKATQIALRAIGKSAKDELLAVLCAVVAAMIDADSPYSHTPHTLDQALGKIRAAANYKAVNGAQLSTFDAEDYFKGVSSKLLDKALAEMGIKNAGPAPRKAKVKTAVYEQAKKGWLPPELRVRR